MSVQLLHKTETRHKMASAQDPKQAPNSPSSIPLTAQAPEKPAPIITDYASL
jgi:hypothetical protein